MRKRLVFLAIAFAWSVFWFAFDVRVGLHFLAGVQLMCAVVICMHYWLALRANAFLHEHLAATRHDMEFRRWALEVLRWAETAIRNGGDEPTILRTVDRAFRNAGLTVHFESMRNDDVAPMDDCGYDASHGNINRPQSGQRNEETTSKGNQHGNDET